MAQAEVSGLGGFFRSLEYGKPVMGVKIPFEWINPSWREGVIEIAEATIRPGGPGIWKLATRPDLILRGVDICGPKQQVAQVIQGIIPQGIYSVKIENFRYQNPNQSERLALQELRITNGKMMIPQPVDGQATKKIIQRILGNNIVFDGW